MPLWKIAWYPIVPLLYPILSAPLMLPALLLKPLQLGIILIVTAVMALNWWIAIGFAILACIAYSISILTPDTNYDRRLLQESTPLTTKLAQIAFLSVMVAVFRPPRARRCDRFRGRPSRVSWWRCVAWPKTRFCWPGCLG